MSVISLAVGALAFSLPPPSSGRREVLNRIAGAGSMAAAFAFAPPAFANYVDGSGAAPKLTGSAYVDSVQAAKNYKFSVTAH
jgi:hypothetical protein